MLILAESLFSISRSAQGLPYHLQHFSTAMLINRLPFAMTLLNTVGTSLFWFQHMFTYISILNRKTERRISGATGFRLKYYVNVTYYNYNGPSPMEHH